MPTEMDVWFTPKKIADVFKDIKKEVDDWREKAEKTQAATPKYFSFFDAAKKEENRFQVIQSISPKLYRIIDNREGDILFELTEVEDGGTSLRVTYPPVVKFRVQTFRAKFPSQVRLDWKPCSSCGRSVLQDYVRCPYCGKEEPIPKKKPKRRKAKTA